MVQPNILTVANAGQIAALQFQYLDLINRVLPHLARQRRFPVLHQHSFQRLILDNLFGCCWSDVLNHREAAYKQLNEDQLRGAIAIAEALISNPDDYAYLLNLNSLRFRRMALSETSCA